MNVQLANLRWLYPLLAVIVLVGKAQGQTQDDELYMSIIDGRVGELISRLDGGMSPNAALRVPESDVAIGLFELAVRAKNDQAATVLLERGAEPRVDPAISTSVFDIVATQGLVGTLQVLIDRDLEGFLSNGASALTHAGQGDAARVVLHRMVAETPSDQLQNALNEALQYAIVSSADLAFKRELVDLGANPETSYALVAAASTCSVEDVELMLGTKVDPNQRYHGRHVAEAALACFDPSKGIDKMEAVALVSLLYRAGSDVCSYAADPLTTTPGTRDALRQAGICVDRLR